VCIPAESGGGTYFTEKRQPSGVSRSTSVIDVAPASNIRSELASSNAPIPLMTLAPGIVVKTDSFAIRTNCPALDSEHDSPLGIECGSCLHAFLRASRPFTNSGVILIEKTTSRDFSWLMLRIVTSTSL
jgi:hypothetical protein